jgi:hypothetical protein
MDALSSSALISLRPPDEVNYKVIQEGMRVSPPVSNSAIIDVIANRVVSRTQLRDRTQFYDMADELDFDSFIDNIGDRSLEEFKIFLLSMMIKYQSRYVCERILSDVIISISYVLSTTDSTSSADWASKIYESHGYRYEVYFGFVNPLNPIYLAASHKCEYPLTPATFEPLSGLWSLKDGEEIAATLSDIDANNEDNIITTLKNLQYSARNGPLVGTNNGRINVWNKYDLVKAITSTLDGNLDKLNLKLITGKSEHSKILLPGFCHKSKRRAGNRDTVNIKRDLMCMLINSNCNLYPLSYYKLVYRRLFNTLTYSSAYMCGMDLLPLHLKTLSVTAGDGKYRSAESLRSVIQKKEIFTPKQEDLDIFAELYEDAIAPPVTIPRCIEEDGISLQRMGEIVSSLIPITKPVLWVYPSKKLIDFLTLNGVSSVDINVAARGGLEKVRDMYERAVRTINERKLTEMGYEPSAYTPYTDEQLKGIVSETIVRTNLFQVIVKFGGNPMDYSSMTNAQISSHLASYIKSNIVLPNKVSNPVYPKFEDLL